MVRTAVALMLLTSVAITTPVLAADTPVTDAAVASVSAVVPADAGLVQRPFTTIRRTDGRSLIMPSLYVSLGVLQAYDVYSTVTGLNRGAVESNPLMGGIAGNPIAFSALKAGVTGATIYTAERLWRQDRKKSAIILMLASNGLMAYVAANNAGVIRGLR